MPTLRPLHPIAPEPETAPALGQQPGLPGPGAISDAAAAAACGHLAEPVVKGRVANPQKYPVSIGPSAIDGQGAFAQTAIPAKAKIGEIRGEFVSMAEARARARQAERSTGRIFMIAISDKRAVDATLSTDPLRFANHSCAPNTVLRIQQGRVAFYAIRDIAAGEELTARYGPTHHAGRLACRCGAPACIGRL